MIVKYPTGLYDSVLPQEPNDSAGVTWLISSTEPPKGIGSATKLQHFGRNLYKPPKVYNDEDRRVTSGDLLFSTTTNQFVDFNSGRKLFEAGQVLEFSDDIPPETKLTSTPDEIFVQHDTNLLDLLDLGLTQDEIDSVTTISYAKKLELERSIATNKVELETIKGQITDNQKQINESDKAIKALELAVGATHSLTIKVTKTKTDALAIRTTLIAQHDIKVFEIDDMYSQLLAISQLVR